MPSIVTFICYPFNSGFIDMLNIDPESRAHALTILVSVSVVLLQNGTPIPFRKSAHR